MRMITAALLVIAATACSSPLDVSPIDAGSPVPNVTAQLKPTPSLVIEKVSGDCTTGITVRVSGENLSPRSRFGNQWLHTNALMSLGPDVVALGNGSKKTVSWEVFWSATTINPTSGPKFDGYAKGVITDSWTGWLHETPLTLIGPAC